MMVPRVRFLTGVVCLALLLCSSFIDVSIAQQKEKNEPVFLKEVSKPPPVREVRSRTLERKYPDNETIRVKYQVVQLSDDSLVNNGPYVEYYKDGQKFQEGKYKRGAYVGEWTYWHPNGQLCRTITYKDGKPDGKWEVFREDGTRLEIQSYKAGTRDGKWQSFYPDGETPLVEFTYQMGEVTGKRISYHKNGKKRQEVSFKKGRMHGLTTEWDDTGKKTLEVKFEEGKRAGDIIRF